VLVIAHRGASAYAPEHTFPAWDLARDMGADYLEQDVHLTADGELVVIHDDSLDRTAKGCSGLVRECSLAQLRGCDVGSWFNGEFPQRARREFADLRIPTLAEVFDRYPGANFYIEIKAMQASPAIEASLLSAIERRGLVGATDGRPRTFVQSFGEGGLEWLHSRNPGLPLIRLLEGETTGSELRHIATYAAGVGPPVAIVDAEFVEMAHALELEVHPWTVDDPGEMRRLLGLGVDALFTNKPDVMRSIVPAS
jgi:glycerophosphoryl diester phosphodiesterase